jgi:hypothetical protein
MNERNETTKESFLKIETETIESLKEYFVATMQDNFKKDGRLQPIFFYKIENNVKIVMIPGEVFANDEGKDDLMRTVRMCCANPKVECAGLIQEAWAKTVEPKSELTPLLMNGNLHVKDLKEKDGIIFMIFATPEKEEMISFYVNPEERTIGKKIGSDGAKTEGTFSNFFKLRK